MNNGTASLPERQFVYGWTWRMFGIASLISGVALVMPKAHGTDDEDPALAATRQPSPALPVG